MYRLFEFFFIMEITDFVKKHSQEEAVHIQAK